MQQISYWASRGNKRLIDMWPTTKKIGYITLAEFVMRMHWDLCLYLFRFPLVNGNYYEKFVNNIGNSKIKIATLNYDRLLDLSIIQSGTKFYRYGIDENSDGVEIIYPHGSSQFIIDEKNMPIVSGCIIVCLDGFHISGKICIADNVKQIENVMNNALPCLPAMCFIEPSKNLHCFSNFLKKSKQRLIESILNCKNLVVIGVSYNKADTHIWKAIKQSNCNLIYCSGKTGKNFRDWAHAVTHRTDRVALSTEGFWRENFDLLLPDAVADIETLSKKLTRL